MTGAIAMTDARMEYSLNGSTWSDCSGYANEIAAAEQTRKTGVTYTFDGDTAIIKAGKREPIDLEITVVYEEGTSSPWEVMRPYFEAGSAVYFRYGPKGTSTGSYRFTADPGYITKWPYPVGKPDTGDPVVVALTLQTARLTKGTV
jgi:hypothetical protein